MGFVSLKIYDALGKEVATLVNSDLSPGRYKYQFDASGFKSGIYFYRIAVHPQSGAFVSDKLEVQNEESNFTETKKNDLN